jgi:hypothetical protein
LQQQQKSISLESEHLRQILAKPSTVQLNTHKFVVAVKPKAKQKRGKAIPVKGRGSP